MPLGQTLPATLRRGPSPSRSVIEARHRSRVRPSRRRTFLAPPAMPTTAASSRSTCRSSGPTIWPTAPGRCGDHDGLAGLGLAAFEQAEIGDPSCTGMPSTPLAVEIGASDGSTLRIRGPPPIAYSCAAEALLDDVADLDRRRWLRLHTTFASTTPPVIHLLADLDIGGIGGRTRACGRAGRDRARDTPPFTSTWPCLGSGHRPLPRSGSPIRRARRAAGRPARRGDGTLGDAAHARRVVASGRF